MSSRLFESYNACLQPVFYYLFLQLVVVVAAVVTRATTKSNPHVSVHGKQCDGGQNHYKEVYHDGIIPSVEYLSNGVCMIEMSVFKDMQTKT
jgi:hypothetical protein